MARLGIHLVLATLILRPVPATAQEPPANGRAIADAAERAAAEAERAATEAERAMIAARHAASAARAAANAARAMAEGRPVILSPQPTPVTAQLPDNENLPVEHAAVSDKDQQRAFAAGVASSVANGPNASPLKSSPVPDIQLIASSKDKVASLAWTMDISGQPRPRQLSAEQLTVTASGKLDDSGHAQILGLDGPLNGNELKLVYTRYVSSVNLSGVEKTAVADARRACEAKAEAKCNPYDYPTGVSSFVAKYNPAGLRPLLAEVLPGPVVFHGLGLSGDQGSFKYLDRTSFALKKVNHFSLGGTVFGGLLLGAGQTAIIGSFDYKRSFDESDPVTICQPIMGTIQTQCLTSADGPPTRSRRSLFGLELRHAFPAPIGSFASLAIAPKFTVDASHGDYSLAFPIYFAGDGTGKLRGGVEGTYVNKKDNDGKRKDDFTLGLFVGVPFTFFPQ